ncbi:anthranilate phosphoribosyltransferase [Desulfohalobiaceae bacterium Ax17]|uniref:anthranilate phosphoribosyltransferase n=1 Tax=Desulfovulcanus ferrireducens TaxID=2831190 RepID=UPI00207BA812|nr:anthranilate phosphoribosyltransferase [Desulfovulcanus ferrireducens]MBT8762620.1 anthranilate phosphoribosyltransferase [Desulfovulcanus ferrireducens]
MNIKDILNKVSEHKDLEYTEAKEVFAALFEGDLTPAQSGALLMGLKSKGECADELLAAVEVALGKARLVKDIEGVRIDTCGTGGDGKQSFNCSTAVAFFLADLGYKVVKHGNKAVSSTCGSADVVEALGLPLLKDPEQVKAELEQRSFAFIFAPHFHPAFALIAPIRQELGIRTIFNLMGPLLNPARPTHQILGVARPEYGPLMAKVLARGDVQVAAVVHGAGGFDELTPCGPAQVSLVREGSVKEITLDPQDYGFSRCEPADLTCENKEEALAMQKEVLSGAGPKAIQDMVALNLGLALSLLHSDKDLKECMDMARDAVAKGIKMIES